MTIVKKNDYRQKSRYRSIKEALVWDRYKKGRVVRFSEQQKDRSFLEWADFTTI